MKFTEHASHYPGGAGGGPREAAASAKAQAPSASDTSPSRQPGRRSDPEEDLPAPATSGPTRNAS